MSPLSRTSWFVVFAAAWIAVSFGGFALVWRHAQTPGDQGQAPPIWPAATHLPSEPGKKTLLVFIHPLCPCSRATIAELRKLMPDVQSRACVVVVATGSGTSAAKTSTDVAETIVFVDAVGEEARRFGAKTSGHVVLYEADGRLAYQGGLTPSRGHEGPSVGSDAIRRALLDRPTTRVRSDVFGCSLFSS